MDLSSLEQIGKSLLDTPKFQKILGDINISDLTKELSKLTSELKELDKEIEASPSGIGVEPGETQEDSKLTREQRKQNRQNKKEKRKKEREQKREELKSKLKKLKQKTIPRFEEYTVTGRVYDSQTAQPLKGVKIKAGVDAAQIGAPNLSPSDSGVNVPSELPALNTDVQLAADFKPYAPVGALIDSKQNTTTDSEGYYSFKFKALVIGVEDLSEDNEKRELNSLLDLGLIFNKPGYLPTTTSLITLNSNIKRDIPTKGMFNLKKAAEIAKDEINNTIYEIGQKASLLALSFPEKIILGRRKSIDRVVSLLTQKLIPLLISILLVFSITKPSQLNQAVCPSPDRLKEAISQRNRAIKQINQIFQAVIVNTGLAVVFLILANALKSIRLSIDALPIPQAYGVPPAKDFGGFLGALNYSFTARLQRLDDLLEELEDQNETLNKQVLISLAFLIGGLIIAQLLLKSIDESVGKCAQDQIDNGEITLEELRDEINQLNEENAEENNIPSNNINGFDLSVVETQNKIGSITRRQAIAKNKDGVIMLKGEESFSATDQVLINELKFYIQSNDLKAF
jgi:hypothetical protein